MCRAEAYQAPRYPPFLFCENPPLLQNFIIISAKPVDALDDKRIARLELFDQALIDRTLKILARLLLLIALLLGDTKLPQGKDLSVIEISTPALSLLEGQKRPVMDYDLNALADILNVSVDWLLGREEM